jgi:hypothetical protein
MSIFNGKTARDAANETATAAKKDELSWVTISHLDLPVEAAKLIEVMFDANDELRKILEETVVLPEGYTRETHEVKFALPIRLQATKSVGVAFAEKKRKGPLVTFKK